MSKSIIDPTCNQEEIGLWEEVNTCQRAIFNYYETQQIIIRRNRAQAKGSTPKDQAPHRTAPGISRKAKD